MLKIVYSFPWEIGAPGIGYTAWQHVNEMIKLGADITLMTGRVAKPFEKAPSRCIQTMTLWRKKVPAKLFGGFDGAAAYHDYRVARHLDKHHQHVDVLHAWPLAAKQSLLRANRHKIMSFIERPNTHTEFAYRSVKQAYEQINLAQKTQSSHTFNKKRLKREEEEYHLANYLLCPSQFVMRTFVERDFPPEKLLRHKYGYDPKRIPTNTATPQDPFKMVFIGNDGVRKGLHIILNAWQKSKASEVGQFHIFGKIDKTFCRHFSELMALPSVTFHGFSEELGTYLNAAHCFALSSFEEGSALVTYEARAAGCVLLVSNSTGALVKHNHNALVHQPGDVDTLTKHIDILFEDRNKFEQLRKTSLEEIDQLTWQSSARLLANIYRSKSTNKTLDSKSNTTQETGTHSVDLKRDSHRKRDEARELV